MYQDTHKGVGNTYDSTLGLEITTAYSVESICRDSYAEILQVYTGEMSHFRLLFQAEEDPFGTLPYNCYWLHNRGALSEIVGTWTWAKVTAYDEDN